MKTMHLFAGAGGGLLADLILGHEPVVAVEWEHFQCEVLRQRAEEGWFPELRVWEGDVRLFDPSKYAGSVDCIHAGFPCQDISVAGKQAGVGEETRSGLYREVLRIAGVVRPRYLFLENVSAIVSNGLNTVIADFTKIGYDTEWLCLRASDCGAPHHRDRWWCLAHSKSNGDWGGQRNIPEKDGRQIGQMRVESIGSSSESKNVADTSSNGLQRGGEDWGVAGSSGLRSRARSDKKQGVRVAGYWDVEPDLGRVANGVAHRVHRLKALGNGQVPLQAAVAWKLLGGP